MAKPKNELKELEKKVEKLEKKLKDVIHFINGQVKTAKVGGDPFGLSTAEIEEL